MIGPAIAAAGSSLLAGGIGTTLAIGSAILGVAGAVVETSAALRQSEFEAKQLAEAQKTAIENSEKARRRGLVDVQDQGRELSQLFEEVLAEQSMTGFSLDSGTFVAQRRRNRVIGRLNDQRIREDAELEAQGFNAEATGYRRQQTEIGKQMFYTKLSGGLQIGSSLIGGATKISEARARAIKRKAQKAA